MRCFRLLDLIGVRYGLAGVLRSRVGVGQLGEYQT